MKTAAAEINRPAQAVPRKATTNMSPEKKNILEELQRDCPRLEVVSAYTSKGLITIRADSLNYIDADSVASRRYRGYSYSQYPRQEETTITLLLWGLLVLHWGDSQPGRLVQWCLGYLGLSSEPISTTNDQDHYRLVCVDGVVRSGTHNVNNFSDRYAGSVGVCHA